jgi:hypothetical protein
MPGTVKGRGQVSTQPIGLQMLLSDQFLPVLRSKPACRLEASR